MSHQDLLQSHIDLLQILLPNLLNILLTERLDLFNHVSSKVLKYFIKVGFEYFRIEGVASVEVGVLLVYVDQVLRGFGDWRWRRGGLEVLSTVSDVEHCCLEILVEGVVVDGVLAP